MKKKLPIPLFKNLEQEAEFWDTHDSEDYLWEETKNVKFAKNLVPVYGKVIPVKIDDDIKKAVESVAKSKGIGISSAARMLIRERLVELKAL